VIGVVFLLVAAARLDDTYARDPGIFKAWQVLPRPIATGHSDVLPLFDGGADLFARSNVGHEVCARVWIDRLCRSGLPCRPSIPQNGVASSDTAAACSADTRLCRRRELAGAAAPYRRRDRVPVRERAGRTEGVRHDGCCRHDPAQVGEVGRPHRLAGAPSSGAARGVLPLARSRPHPSSILTSTFSTSAHR